MATAVCVFLPFLHFLSFADPPRRRLVGRARNSRATPSTSFPSRRRRRRPRLRSATTTSRSPTNLPHLPLPPQRYDELSLKSRILAAIERQRSVPSSHFQEHSPPKIDRQKKPSRNRSATADSARVFHNGDAPSQERHSANHNGYGKGSLDRHAHIRDMKMVSSLFSLDPFCRSS